MESHVASTGTVRYEAYGSTRRPIVHFNWDGRVGMIDPKSASSYRVGFSTTVVVVGGDERLVTMPLPSYIQHLRQLTFRGGGPWALENQSIKL